MPIREWETAFTFEEAFEKFKDLSEKYGHIDTVSLVYNKGNFNIFYSHY